MPVWFGIILISVLLVCMVMLMSVVLIDTIADRKKKGE